MKFFNVISVDEGKEKIIQNFKNINIGVKKQSILNSIDMILAEDIISEIDVPQFNRSTVDGYAVKSEDTYGATQSIPSMLSITGEVMMGMKTERLLQCGQAIYVPTGGMLPKGTDSVVMIENTSKLDEETLEVYKPSLSGNNIIFRGDDIKRNQILLQKGHRLTPQDIGVLAAIGRSQVKVYCKPKFYIISTGDEIIDIDEELKIGKIRDINGYALSSIVKKIGGKIIKRVIIKDNLDNLTKEIHNAVQCADFVIISGGSSVGTRDYTYSAINSLQGKGVFIHGLSIKPGKPTLVGEVNGKAVFGLPGHPVSAIIVFKVLAEYLVKKLMNSKGETSKIRAIIDSNIHSDPGKQTYKFVNIYEKNNKLFASPNYGKSGLITLLSKSSGYIVIKSNEEGVYEGEERYVYLI